MIPGKTDNSAIQRRWSARGYITGGMIALGGLVGGLGGWSAFASISGAVIASGQIQVETQQQVVQHLDGGVVGEIYVRDGDTVEAGDIMLRLDDSLLTAELSIIESQLFEIIARRGRLTAEANSETEITFDAELLEEAATRPDIAELVEGQERLFVARAETFRRETEQLRERQLQVEQEIAGSEAQQAALTTQRELISREAAGQRKLYKDGLAPLGRLLALEREAARLEGSVGELTSGIARAKGQIAELEIQIVSIGSRAREEAITTMRDLQYREAELRERRATTKQTLSRLDVRAPRSGRVHGMTVHTVNGVVTPAEPIGFVIPSDVDLLIEAQLESISIDQVYPGQNVVLRFSAFNMRSTPEFDGHIKQVSADVFLDERTGISTYKLEIALNEGELDRLHDLQLELLPGMPVETYIQTDERTPISYLTKPLADYFNKALREE